MSTRRAPPYRVVALAAAVEEAKKILTDVQYKHVVDLVRRLAWFGHPEKLTDVDIEKMRGMKGVWELKEKGGVLGKINLRVYFFVGKEEIVLLKTYKKTQSGSPPTHILENLEDRLEMYREGKLKVFTKYPKSKKRNKRKK